MMSTDEFSVCQFFVDGSHEYVARFVSATKAMECFAALTRSVGAKLGTTKRVIVTDGGDFVNCEWQHEKGITYPPELAGYQ